MSAKRFFIGLFLIILVLVVAGGGFYIWKRGFEAPLGNYVLKVEPGQTLLDIAGDLQKAKVITFKTPFVISSYLYGASAIEAGAYELSADMPVTTIVKTLSGKPAAEYVTIPPNTSKQEMGDILGKALSWSELDRQFFAHTLAGMQWQRYMTHIEGEFLRRYAWSQGERETFLSLSSLYDEKEYDFLRNVYEPGTYQIPVDASRAQAAGIIIDQFSKIHGDREYQDMVKLLDVPTMDKISKLIHSEMELLPDIVAVPPRDVTLRKENGRTYLLFSTLYWNKGRGPLELVADPKTKSIRADINRNVYQRIYRLDGDYRERLSGNFLWHQPHLHYHFQGFAEYKLEAVDSQTKTFRTVGQAKSTFCIRDSEPIDLAHPGAGKTPSYSICGKERQGISAGWADAYYYTYVDQRFDVTNAPEGQYLLSIVINPENRFDEITLDNNRGEALILLNVKDDFVKVIEERAYGK
jgi:hypothetical protein